LGENGHDNGKIGCFKQGRMQKQVCSKLVREMGRVLVEKAKKMVGKWWSSATFRLSQWLMQNLDKNSHENNMVGCKTGLQQVSL
jgi:hypothetical protein